jgi:hypothetical protein
MHIIHAERKKKVQVFTSVLSNNDLKALTKQRFYFNWKDKKLQNDSIIYKLFISQKDILGVMALIDFPAEQRIEIKLLAVAKENVGKDKIYKGIAGCLIALACKICVQRYGSGACVSLIPKTELKNHYITEYGMQDAGWQIYLEANSLFNIIDKFKP